MTVKVGLAGSSGVSLRGPQRGRLSSAFIRNRPLKRRRTVALLSDFVRRAGWKWCGIFIHGEMRSR